MPTITIVPGTDTVNQMRIAHNDNDTALKTETEQATADIAAHKAAQNTDHDARYSKVTDLNTHKTSTDHDSRYYTEGEIDAAVVKLTGDQTVAGVKTLTSNPIVKNATPAYELKAADGTPIGRVLGQLVGGEDNRVALQYYDKSASQFVTGLSINEDGSILDENGLALATREYVQQRVRSAYFSIAINGSGTAAGSAVFNCPQRLVVPNGARLTSVAYLRNKSDDFVAYFNEAAASYVFTTAGHRFLHVQVFNGPDYSGFVFPYIKVYAGKIVTGDELEWTEILTVGSTQDAGIAVTSQFSMHIQLGFTL